MNSHKLEHLQKILNNDFKDNNIEEFEMCRKDIESIYNPNPYEYLLFNKNRDDMKTSIISIDDLYKSLKKNMKFKSLNISNHNNIKTYIKLNESYIYLFKLIYAYKSLNFCKLLSNNFVDNHDIYNIDVIYNILKI